MRWEDPSTVSSPSITTHAVDVRYRICCSALPVDHAEVLQKALLKHWPWLADEALAGIHTLHGAESGNGWIRPEDPATYLPLSRRTRLVVRLPRHRTQEAKDLCGACLTLGPDSMNIIEARLHVLQTHGTLFARYIALQAEDEEVFLQECANRLETLGITIPRMLAGRQHSVACDSQVLQCRSLMVDGLSPEASIQLQEQGLGPHRLLGCGLFLPHKSIAPVGATAEQE